MHLPAEQANDPACLYLLVVDTREGLCGEHVATVAPLVDWIDCLIDLPSVQLSVLDHVDLGDCQDGGRPAVPAVVELAPRLPVPVLTALTRSTVEALERLWQADYAASTHRMAGIRVIKASICRAVDSSEPPPRPAAGTATARASARRQPQPSGHQPATRPEGSMLAQGYR